MLLWIIFNRRIEKIKSRKRGIHIMATIRNASVTMQSQMGNISFKAFFARFFDYLILKRNFSML